MNTLSIERESRINVRFRAVDTLLSWVAERLKQEDQGAMFVVLSARDKLMTLRNDLLTIDEWEER